MAQATKQVPARKATAAELNPQLDAGYAAQGFALAQSMIGVIKSHATDYTRFVATAWDLSIEARDYARKELDKFVRTCRENAKVTHPVEGIKPEVWGSIASTATVRASQFGRILRAMNAGMTLQTLGEKVKVPDPKNLSFDTVLGIAKLYAQSEAEAGGRGRPRTSFLMKLARFIANESKKEDNTKEDMAAINKIMKMIGDMLPDLEEADKTKKQENKVAAAKRVMAKKKPAKPLVTLPTGETIVERRQEDKVVKQERRAAPHEYHQAAPTQH